MLTQLLNKMDISIKGTFYDPRIETFSNIKFGENNYYAHF